MLSFNELVPPVTSFVRFLENLKKIVKDKKPSIYVVTNAFRTDSTKIESTLARLAEEIPEHSEMILDIKKKFVIFPKPIHGKFNEDKQLAIIRQKLSKIKPTLIDPDLHISDGAKNKMREFLDVFDKQLKDNLEKLFEDYLSPLVMKSALELDIESIKEFKSLTKIEELPDFLIKKMQSFVGESEEGTCTAIVYLIIIESIKAILEYRNLLIGLAEKEECGIFNAYFKTLIDKNVKHAERILESDFHLCSRELEFQIRNKIINKFFTEDKDKISQLRNLLKKSRSVEQDELIALFNQEVGVQWEAENFRIIKEKLTEMNQGYYQNIRKVQSYMKNSIETLIDVYLQQRDKIEELQEENEKQK
jgi:hypothetical protein